jgi:hypothetical protein
MSALRMGGGTAIGGGGVAAVSVICCTWSCSCRDGVELWNTTLSAVVLARWVRAAQG